MKRKLFAMVLAAAMSLSLGVIAAHGYADDKDITNNEAVAVMSAVGVLKGTEDGTNFAPKDELDRASAAKIITYLAVGPTAADSMKASEAPFDDVPASHWAAGFIAYCKTSGIIAGDGSGKFNPSDKVKTNEFAKMLLTVLGYDAGIEGMTGAQWSVNTSKLASANDLYDDITKGVGENLVREEAAQLAFNTLLADTYEYESKGTQIDLGSGSVNIGATPAKAIENTKNDYKLSVGTKPNANVGQDTNMQLVEKLYGEKFKKVSSGINDDFGRPGYKYTYDSKNVWNGSEDSLLTYNKKRSNKVSDVSTDLKNAGINVTVADKVYTMKNSNNTANVPAKLFLNGKEETQSADLGELLALSNAPGKETEFFAKDGEITTVAVTEYTVGTVDSVSELKDSSGNAYTQYVIIAEDGVEGDDGYTIANPTNAKKTVVEGPTLKAYADSTKKDNNTILHSDVKKGDVITYVKVHDQNNDKDVWHVYGTTVVKGKQTGYSSSDGESTISDKTYKWGTGVLGFNASEAQNNSDDERNFYIDKNGYLVKCDEAADSSDYVYAKDIVKSGKNGEATLVFPDGTSKDVKITSLKIKSGKDNLVEELDATANSEFDGFYTYTKSGDDYKLTSLDSGETEKNKNDAGLDRGLSAYSGDTIIEKKKSTLANGLATIGSSTKVIVYDGDAYTVYSGGLSNMPTITKKANGTKTAEVYCVMEKDGQTAGSKAKLVYISVDTGSWDIEDSSTKEYFYIYTKDAPSSTRVNGDDFYTYTVASDGGTKKITFNGDVYNKMDEEANPMYRITRTDKNGNITGVSAVGDGKNIVVLKGDDTSKIADITSETISFTEAVGNDKVNSIAVTDKTIVTRIQDKEVNGGTGGSNLNSVKNYVKKDDSGKNKIEALYVFCNSDGDAEKVYVVVAKG